MIVERRNKYYLSALFSLIAAAVQCQNNTLKEVEDFLDGYHYSKVIELCEGEIENDNDPEPYAKYLADSYRLTNKPERCAYWLGYLAEFNLAEQEDYLNLAIVLKTLGEYESAMKWFRYYDSHYPGNKLVDRHLSNANYANSLGLKNPSISLENVRIANTKMNDFGAIEHQGKIIFSSSRKEGASHKKTYKWDGENYLDIYFIPFNGKEVKSFSNTINSPFHEGPICFSSDGKTAYFTRNNFINGKKRKLDDGTINLQIYSSKKVDGNWGEIKEFDQNIDGYSSGHATISSDGKVMVYVSNKADGEGKTDMYMCSKGTYGWEKPVNLGKLLNTEASEMFPFLHEDGTLYFSSDGHLGLGGLDIFKCSNFLDGQRIVEHLDAPLNSEMDDFCFYLNKEGSKGYISSNRTGGMGGDDIYSFTLLKESTSLKIMAQVFSGLDENPLLNTTAELWSENSLIETIKTDNSGKFMLSFSQEQCPLILKVSNGDEWSSYEAEISHCQSDQEDINLGEIILNRQENSYHAMVDVSEKKASLQSENEYQVVQKQPSTQISSVYKEVEQRNPYQVGFYERNMSHGNNKTNGERSTVEGLLITVTDRATGQTWQTESPYSGDINLALNRNSTGERVTENTMSSNDYLNLGSFEKDRAILLENIFYDTGKWLLRNEATLELDKLIRTLYAYPNMKIELSSHTDSRGSATENLSLSQKRAMAAVRYILDSGISPTRINGKGYGEYRLLNRCADGTNCSEREHQQNRRTEVTILSY